MPSAGPLPVPRGVEVLLKKAAVDPPFRKALLAERSRAAARIGLSLTAAEAAMLDALPAAYLERVVARTNVPPRYRAVFMGYAAAAMLAVLGASKTAAEPAARVAGIEPDEPPPSRGNDYPLVDILPSPDDDAWLKTLSAPADAGAIAVAVTNAAGYPVEGAYVSIRGTVDGAGVTDADGHFFLTSLPAGPYLVLCSRADYAAATEKNVAVREGLVTYVKLTLLPRQEDLLTKGIRP